MHLNLPGTSLASGGGGTRHDPGGGTGNSGACILAARLPPRKEGGGWQYLGPGVGNNALGCRRAAVSRDQGTSS